MNKQQELVMLSDLEYQKRLNDMNAKLVINLSARIRGVRELHVADAGGYCDQCQSNYPCATIELLNGEQSD
jgi:hypothetical protein